MLWFYIMVLCHYVYKLLGASIYRHTHAHIHLHKCVCHVLKKSYNRTERLALR